MTAQTAQVLLVDDDVQLCQLLSDYLSAEGFDLKTATNGVDALALLRETNTFDAVVLDIMMPQLSGLDALKQLRQFSDIPVLMLTGRGDDIDRILGLEMGADDYLGKPCNPRELGARLRAVLRRSRQPKETESAPAPMSAGALTLDATTLSATYNGEPLGLTGAEFRTLQLLVEHQGQVLSKDFLTEQVLQRKLARYDRSIDVHVSRIRQKLSQITVTQQAVSIKAIRGMGYQFICDVSDDEN